ncbi:MAG: EF-Tu/IF-2/RF-3 family GTPase [Methanomicrobiales archaeon]|nr:EF-Tu/IF-2/RF-3 family GTPase [Methanomicrobiales archaeon]
MPNLTIAVIGPEGYASQLGKKGTTSDITFYNAKKDQNTVTYIEPSRYPERVSSLFYAVSTADMALLVVDEMTPAFGESVVMLDMVGVERGVVVCRNYLSREEVLRVVKGTVVERFAFEADDPVHLRERFLAAAKEASHGGAKGAGVRCGAVAVDHHFPVKGVGTVALGGVVEGTIRVHNDLRVLPTEKVAHVRSIQTHDDDVSEASRGDRVGLALKGIEAEELDRGYVLSNDPSLEVSRVISGRAELVRYWKAPLREGMIVHLGHWMQFVPARIAFVDSSGDWRRPVVTLRADRELVHPRDGRIIIHYLEGERLRVVGGIVPR